MSEVIQTLVETEFGPLVWGGAVILLVLLILLRRSAKGKSRSAD